MYGSTLQAPYDMGALTLQVAYQCLTEGSEGIEANTYTDIPVVYIENASDTIQLGEDKTKREG